MLRIHTSRWMLEALDHHVYVLLCTFNEFCHLCSPGPQLQLSQCVYKNRKDTLSIWLLRNPPVRSLYLLRPKATRCDLLHTNHVHYCARMFFGSTAKITLRICTKKKTNPNPTTTKKGPEHYFCFSIQYCATGLSHQPPQKPKQSNSSQISTGFTQEF